MCAFCGRSSTRGTSERIGELLDQHLPGVPVTLSHAVNPSIREYRRASATCIDASLKPLMGEYLEGMSARLRAAGFAGAVMVVTSQGGVMEAADIARAPIHAIKSGPAMAPVAGRVYAVAEGGADTAIVADTGGTSYDVSLVRRTRIPWTRETWIGPPYRGHMTGFPSVDVRSIGAGGGSIAAVDDGGPAPRRAGERRRGAWSGLLRPGRRASHGDGCRARPRLPRPGLLPRRPMRLHAAAAVAVLSRTWRRRSASTSTRRPPPS